ncbi:MAG: HAD-IA family hydrolase [Candidatus Pacearchaeota archaeon]
MIKIIFFDFDGTITETKDIVEKTFFEVLDRLEYKYEKSKIKKLLGVKTEEFFLKIGVDKKSIKKLKNIFYENLLKKIYFSNLKLCSSIKPLYNLKKYCKLIIISNNEREFLDVTIKKLKIENLFDEVYGADSFSSKDEMLKKLMKKYKIKPNETIYVGDRFSDVIYAKKAKCISVAIHNSCSWSSLKEIKKFSPDYIIKDFKELKKIIKSK